MTGPARSGPPQAAADDRQPFTRNGRLGDQVADRIEKRIRSGEFDEKGKLPGALDLAEWYSVSVKVIGRARAELEKRGLVRLDPGRGTFLEPAAQQQPGDPS